MFHPLIHHQMSPFKLSILLILVVGLTACTSQKATVTVPANQSIELTYPEYDVASAKVRNRSGQALQVAVLDLNREQQRRGFGLGKMSSATVWVEGDSKLVLQNEGDADAQVKVKITPEQRPAPATPAAPVASVDQSDAYVNFTLQNKTAQSIPLLIPSVMNPNLSPFSKSGVSLKIGQEVLFRENGRRYVLFTVDASIQPGAVVDVAQRLKARRQELGL